MYKKIAWLKADTVQNININLPRKSMSAIVLFFKDDNADNEVFPYSGGFGTFNQGDQLCMNYARCLR